MVNKRSYQVWWIPQVPGKRFFVPVSGTADAIRVMDILADYDLFQYENRIKPDYANAGGLEVLVDEEWEEWTNSDGEEINDLRRGGK